MGPARQRLEPGNFARLQIDQRLIGQFELVAVERAAQLGLDREAAPRRACFLGLIDLRLAHRLGLLDRELRLAEQFLGLLAARHQRHPDRTFDADLELAQPERRGHHVLDALGRGKRIGHPAAQPDQHAELIAPGARQHVAGAQGGNQPPRKGDQQFVAGEAAHRFVDPAKAPHVDHQHGMVVLPPGPCVQPRCSIDSVKLTRLGSPVRLSRSISARSERSARTSTLRSTRLTRQRLLPCSSRGSGARLVR